MTRRIPAYSVERSNEAIKSIHVVSTSDRDRSKTDWHKIRVGVSVEGRTDWLGEYDGAKQSLSKDVRFILTGDGDLNYLLPEDGEVVVEITTGGSPSSLDGMKVAGRGHRIGELSDDENARADDSSFPGSRVLKQKVFTGVDEPGVERLASMLNDNGVTDFGFEVPLNDLNTDTNDNTGYVYVDEHTENNYYTSGFQQVSSTTYANVTNMSGTFSGLDSDETYELRVNHGLCGFGATGSNANGLIKIDIGGITTLVDSQSNGPAFFNANGQRNNTSAFALIRFTSQTSVTITQQTATASGTARFDVQASDWQARLYRVVS